MKTLNLALISAEEKKRVIASKLATPEWLGQLLDGMDAAVKDEAFLAILHDEPVSLTIKAQPSTLVKTEATTTAPATGTSTAAKISKLSPALVNTLVMLKKEGPLKSANLIKLMHKDGDKVSVGAMSQRLVLLRKAGLIEGKIATGSKSVKIYRVKE